MGRRVKTFIGRGVPILTWYNAITDGYDGRIWLEGAERSYDSYGLYIWGNKVFLRDEASAGGYTNRVLVCDLEYADWKKLAGKK